MRIRQFPDPDQFRQMAENANVIPVGAEILADTDTPVSLLKKCMGPGRSTFLFESVEGGERWGRYSFMGTSAKTHLRVFHDRVTLSDGHQTETLIHNGDPLSVMRTVMARYRAADISGLPRFWGGLVGHMNYEMVSFIERIDHQWPSDQPMAHFIIPDELIIFDNVRHTLVALAPGFIEDGDDPGRVYEQARERVEALLETIRRPLVQDEAPSDAEDLKLTARVTPDDFRDRVKRVKAYIGSGDIIQAVIAQPFDCPAPKDVWSLYRAQRFVNPSPYLFFMQLDETVLVGSSPETMVRLESGVATLRPIAGTRPRGETEQADRALADEMLGDEKERAEHLMLVDLGRNDLGRVARIGTVQVTDLMVVERYSHVMHLVSNITADLTPDTDAFDLIRATFPAGTLSGAPKVRAMEIIHEMEAIPRGPYGGAVGYIAFNGNMDLAITIRTACVQGDRLTVRAGAGIVADSDPESERMETINKAKAIERALELTASGMSR